MARAPGHNFGQIIGNFCEKSLGPILKRFADEHGLYLDQKGKRPARSGQSLLWKNKYGFCNSLDYVLERGGTPERFGTPVAFIECAWRRYTKHSVNKAAEITGAVLPVVEENCFSAPMFGCLLVGDYSSQPKKQLKEIGFSIVHIKYETVIKAFQTVGMDVRYDDNTDDDVHRRNKASWKSLSDSQKTKVWDKLVSLNRAQMGVLLRDLERAVNRVIESDQGN